MEPAPVEGEFRMINNVLYRIPSTGVASCGSYSPITIQSATPVSSPNTTYTTPGVIEGFLQPSATIIAQSFPAYKQAIEFSTLPAIPEPPYTLSAQMLLEILPPSVPARRTDYSYPSSAVNRSYANIRRLSPLPLPSDLSGYNNLPLTALESSPSIGSNSQSRGRSRCNPCLPKLHYMPSELGSCKQFVQNWDIDCPIRSRSEDMNCFLVHDYPTTVNHLSRVEFSWEVLVNSQWHKFAVLEFKRPGALDSQEWITAAIGTGSVTGSGEKICRQLVKYGCSWGLRYVAACTWEHMVLLYLEGDMSSWYHGEQEDRSISAQISWVNGQKHMKRNLYVFLRYALRNHLQLLGYQVN